MSARVPRLAVLAWTIAVLVIAGLAVAVSRFLTGGGLEHSMSSAMSMGTADALTRGGSRSPIEPLIGSALFTRWQLDSVAVAVLVLLAAAYLTGVALVPVRSPGRRWPWTRTAGFFAGLAVCAFATNGSIAVYDQVLFTAHMAGHLALVMLAPALLMWGRPLTLVLAAAAPRHSARLARVLRGRVAAVVFAPPVALATYAVVIVGSHLTGLMDSIMRSTWAGQVEHLVYVLVGCQFFALIVGDEPIRWRLASPVRWLLLAVAMAVDTFVGIVLLQGTAAIYLQPSALHVDALSDTRTGGAIMWFGGDAIMAAIMVGLVITWLRRVESSPADAGWLEQARFATFAAHTGGAEQQAAPLDEDADAHDAYNEWLARLGGKS